MDDSNLAYYSFLPVAGSDNSVVAFPYLHLSDDTQGSLNDQTDISLADSDGLPVDGVPATVSDSSDVLVVRPLEDLERDNALMAVSPSGNTVSVSDIGTDPPDYLLFNGAVWISGYDYRLGDITLYFPPDTKSFWGTDSEGYLIYLGSASSTGYLEGLSNPSLYASLFSRPRYRDASNQYQTIVLQPTNSNAPIATGDVPRFTMWDMLPLLSVGLLGVIVLFTSKLFR